MENIYYINLDHRIDRKKHIEKQLDDLEWKYTRFSAIKHEIGAIGCSMSHLKLLEYAKENNLDYIVIIEDDMTITDMDLFKTQLNKVLNSNINYDVLLLGGNSHPIPQYQYISDFCIRTFNCKTTIGYIVKKYFYNILIQNFKEGLDNLIKYKNKKIYACDIY